MTQETEPVHPQFSLLDGIESRAVIAVLTEPVRHEVAQHWSHRWSNYGGLEIPQAGQDY